MSLGIHLIFLFPETNLPLGRGLVCSLIFWCFSQNSQARLNLLSWRNSIVLFMILGRIVQMHLASHCSLEVCKHCIDNLDHSYCFNHFNQVLIRKLNLPNHNMGNCLYCLTTLTRQLWTKPLASLHFSGQTALSHVKTQGQAGFECKERVAESGCGEMHSMVFYTVLCSTENEILERIFQLSSTRFFSLRL